MGFSTRYSTHDKYDSYKPDIPSFVNTDYRVSEKYYNFHIAYMKARKTSDTGPSISMGVGKKEFLVSGSGIAVDMHHIGKSDI